MRRIVVTKGTTVRIKKGGDFVSTDSKDKVHLKKGTVLKLLEVLFTPESMLAEDVKTNVKFLIPQVFIVDDCEIVMLPKVDTIENVYILHDEFKDVIDWKSLAVVALYANTLVLLANLLISAANWFMKLS